MIKGFATDIILLQLIGYLGLYLVFYRDLISRVLPFQSKVNL